MYVYLGRAEPVPRSSGETTGPVIPLALRRVLEANNSISERSVMRCRKI
jgi:hypothetical protein